MSIRANQYAILATALLLGGCAYANNLFGTNWSAESSGPSKSAANKLAGTLGSSSSNSRTSHSTNSTTAETTTSTTVGKQVQKLKRDLGSVDANLEQRRQELAAIRASMKRHSQVYVDTVVHIASQLKSGTTPGNPKLTARWIHAQDSLDHLNGDIDQLSRLSDQLAGDVSLASNLTKTTSNALSLQGGIEADHRRLTDIKNKLDGITKALGALLNTVANEVAQQSNKLANGTKTLTTLAQAIKIGRISRIRVASNYAIASQKSPANVTRPFVVIRFDRANVKYVDALYTAINRALERDPAAKFKLVAVSPSANTVAQIAANSKASRENAEDVMRSLIKMGLPPDRVTLSATMSSDVQSKEVRIYVR